MVDVTHASDGDFRTSIAAFEAVVAAKLPELIDAELRRILVMLDGSNQDLLSLGIAKALVRTKGEELVLAHAYEGERQEAKEQVLAERVAAFVAEGIPARAFERRAAPDLRSHQQILGMVEAEQPQLLICDAPYLDDFDELGYDSVGSNLDLLLARSPVPVLVVRDPALDPEDCLERLIVPVTPWDAELVQAGAWAERLLSPGGTVRLLLIVDEERLRQSGVSEPFTIEEADEEMLSGLYQPSLAGLVAAMQKRASDRGHHCRVSLRSGDLPATILEYVEDSPGLIVAATPRDPQAPLYQRTQALVRGSRWPVLVI
ncbi:MAG: hypothetical protein CSA62_00460 [Planctomycetota bacterium]|nr:MAG: hypothetical protein CSA62_00460 [Planctomycetota bacterium]